jgi:methylmalonyl-CoA/ethylmalonyl-CoA epimerase
MIIDHIGIAVKSINESIEYWKRVFGYKQKTEVIINTIQKVKVVFLSKDNSIDIKLIEPIDESSPVYRHVLKGGGLHHVCFKCNDMSSELERLINMDLRLLTPPQPGEAFENEKIAFLLAKNGLNIELIDTDKKACTINEELLSSVK